MNDARKIKEAKKNLKEAEIIFKESGARGWIEKTKKIKIRKLQNPEP